MLFSSQDSQLGKTVNDFSYTRVCTIKTNQRKEASSSDAALFLYILKLRHVMASAPMSYY